VARLFLRGYLVNNTIYPEYEIGAQDLIDAFIGDDTGAPLSMARFVLETDDGYRIDINVPAPGKPGHEPRLRATEMRANVFRVDSDPALMDSLKEHCRGPED
jgi:hypothetical protein